MFLSFLWAWFLVSVPCGPRNCLIWFQFSWTCWALFCVLSCGLSLKIFHVYLKTMCTFHFGMKSKRYISIWSKVLFNAAIILLTFCLEDLSIFDSGVLKFPTIILLLSISFLKFSRIFLIYLGAPMLDAYMFIMFMFSWWILPLSIMKCPSGSLFMAFVLESILSDISIATLAFYIFLSICLEYFLSSFHFQPV